MAKLNLNFHEVTGLRKPTTQEIGQLQELGFSIEAIIKTLGAYAANTNNRTGTSDKSETVSVCMCVCNVLELLIKPLVDYMGDSAGDMAATEPDEGRSPM